MNVNFLTHDGKPVFVVIPYNEYRELLLKAGEVSKHEDNLTIPQEVVDLKYDTKCTLIRAWRLYLDKTQLEVATELGISQGAYSQIENNIKCRRNTLVKLAKVFGVETGQLTLR